MENKEEQTSKVCTLCMCPLQKRALLNNSILIQYDMCRLFLFFEHRMERSKKTPE